MYSNNLDYKYIHYNIYGFSVFNSLGMAWSLGFILIILIFFQIITGFFLSCSMIGIGLEGCYFSKIYVFMEISYGWVVVNLHSLSPSFIFIFIFFHIFKVIIFPVFYFSFAWLTGFIMFIIFMILGFTGYSLVCGAMGYWAIMVMQNMVGHIFGEKIGVFVFSSLDIVTNSILFKMFSYHFFLGIMCFLVMYFHIYLNHKILSSPVLCSFYLEVNSFISVMMMKDLYIVFFTIINMLYFIFFYPEILYSCDNFLPVNIFSVPKNINAEWYLSVFIIILKSMPFKSLGVFFMLFFVILLFLKYFISNLLGFQFLSVFISILMLIIYFNLIIKGSFHYLGELFSMEGYIMFMFVIMFLDFLLIFYLFLYLNM